VGRIFKHPFSSNLVKQHPFHSLPSSMIRASGTGADALRYLIMEASFWKFTASSPGGTNCVLSASQI